MDNIPHLSEVTVGELIRFLNAKCAEFAKDKKYVEARAYACLGHTVEHCLVMFEEEYE